MVSAAAERVARDIPRHAINPASGLLYILSRPPSLVETKERLLGSFLGRVWIHPAGNQKSDDALPRGDKQLCHLLPKTLIWHEGDHLSGGSLLVICCR
jgi:hypothetical protein